MYASVRKLFKNTSGYLEMILVCFHLQIDLRLEAYQDFYNFLQL